MNWNDFFIYDCRTGLLRWKDRPRNHFSSDIQYRRFKTRFAGEAVGCPTRKEALSVGLYGKRFPVHRVIWEMHNGPIPAGMVIDHKDMDAMNNVLSNLRLATKSQNAFNVRRSKNNRSGIKGVVFSTRDKKWTAQIGFDGKQKHLGSFHTKGLAAVAYAKAAIRYHGEFARFA